MASQRPLIDKLIHSALEKVAQRKFFNKSAVMREILDRTDLRKAMAEIRGRYPEWHFDQIIVKYTHDHIGRHLQAKDANGIRLYECYAVGSKERRWQTFGSMTADKFELVMKQARTQEERMRLKGEGCQIWIDALKEIGRYAQAHEVYDKVVPLILKLRAKAA